MELLLWLQRHTKSRQSLLSLILCADNILKRLPYASVRLKRCSRLSSEWPWHSPDIVGMANTWCLYGLPLGMNVLRFIAFFWKVEYGRSGYI